MEQLETEYYIGTHYEKLKIKYGDILKSSATHDVVVMYDTKNKKPIVKVINETIFGENPIFDLSTFLNSWKDNLYVDGNVNYI